MNEWPELVDRFFGLLARAQAHGLHAIPSGTDKTEAEDGRRLRRLHAAGEKLMIDIKAYFEARINEAAMRRTEANGKPAAAAPPSAPGVPGKK